MINSEKNLDDSAKKLKKFKVKIISHIKKIKSLLLNLKNKQKKISIYGASGKGQALMHL